MIRKYWKIMLVAAGALVSAAFYLFTPEAGAIMERSMAVSEGETKGLLLLPDGDGEAGEWENAEEETAGMENFGGGLTDLQKEQIGEIVRECISEEISAAVSMSVREVIMELRDDGTLTEALYAYADEQAGLININEADAALLKTLPGIGDAKATAVIRYRDENGAFKSVDELLNVNGISEKILEGIRNDITV